MQKSVRKATKLMFAGMAKDCSGSKLVASDDAKLWEFIMGKDLKVEGVCLVLRVLTEHTAELSATIHGRAMQLMSTAFIGSFHPL